MHESSRGMVAQCTVGCKHVHNFFFFFLNNHLSNREAQNEDYTLLIGRSENIRPHNQVLLLQTRNKAWELGRRMLKKKHLVHFSQNLLGKYLLNIATVQKLG